MFESGGMRPAYPWSHIRKTCSALKIGRSLGMGELTRRELLRISAGTLLTLGLWPGRLRGDDLTGVGDFAFVVLNDLHFREPACAPLV